MKDDRDGRPAPAGPAGSPAPGEHLLAALADLLPHAVFAKDAVGRYLFSNRAHAALLGHRDASEVVGRTAAELGRGNDPLVRWIEGAAGDGGAERSALGPDGRPRTYRVLTRALPAETGKQPGLLGVAMDVTEASQLRNEIEQHDLKRLRDLAEPMPEAEAFGYSVSHDLRAPVRAVSGFAEILLGDHGESLSGEARLLVERIAAAGATMSAMVEGMLTLSQLGSVELQRTSIDLSALVREVWADVLLAEKGRAVEFSAADGFTIWADACLVRSVIQNLLGNAFKYTRGREGAKVEFGMAHADGDAHFFVRDNGSGFDMAHAGGLFGVFHRLHHASEFEGTGIGLATAQRIVLRHGGRIWAEARPGEGATFRFTFGPHRT